MKHSSKYLGLLTFTCRSIINFFSKHPYIRKLLWWQDFGKLVSIILRWENGYFIRISHLQSQYHRSDFTSNSLDSLSLWSVTVTSLKILMQGINDVILRKIFNIFSIKKLKKKKKIHMRGISDSTMRYEKKPKNIYFSGPDMYSIFPF